MAEVNPTPGTGSAGQRDRRWKRRWLAIVKLLVTAGIVYAIVDRIQIADIRTEFVELHWRPLLIGIALIVPNLAVQYFKWRYLVTIIEPHTPAWRILGSLMFGFSVGLVTPGRLGEMGRGFYITEASTSRLTGMAIIDKVLSQWALALCGLVGLVVLLLDERETSVLMEWLCVIMAVLFVLFNLVLIRRPSVLRGLIRMARRAVLPLPFSSKIAALLSVSEEFRRHHTLPGLTYALLFQAVILAQFFFFINAFTTMELFDALVAASAAMFVKSLLPIALMDLGVREGAVIYFFGLVGSGTAAAFNTSILIFLTNVLLPGSIGVYFVLQYNLAARHEH